MKIRKVDMKEAGTGEITMEYAEKTFKELLAFQGYGFCLGRDVKVLERERGEIMLGDVKAGDWVLGPGDVRGERYVQVLHVWDQGVRRLFKVDLANGLSVKCTDDHKILCEDGNLREAADIPMSGCAVACRPSQDGPVLSKITSITYLGEFPTMDITVDSRSHLFYANGIIVSNCKAHAVSYSVYSAVQMWLQEHYFLEYMCTLLTHIDRAKEKKGHLILNERVAYCIKHGTSILYPNVNESGYRWVIRGGALLAPLKNIKGFSDREVRIIEEGRPYGSLKEFMEKTGFNRNRFETLLFSHSLDCFLDGGEDPCSGIERMYNWYLNEYGEDGKGKAKKASGTEDLFGGIMGDDDASSSLPHVSVTREEIEERCLDYNGFVVYDNLLNKYHEYYDMKLCDVYNGRDDLPGNIRNSPVRRLSVINEDCPEIRREWGKDYWCLCEVKKVSNGMKTKYGSLAKVSITDGETSDELLFWNGVAPSAMRTGCVMVVPITVKYDEQKERISHYYCKRYAEYATVIYDPEKGDAQ